MNKHFHRPALTPLSGATSTSHRVSALPENGVVTVLWVGLTLQFVDKIQINQLIDSVQKLCQTGDADDAINHVLLVADANNHALFLDSAHACGLRLKALHHTFVGGANLDGGNKCSLHKSFQVGSESPFWPQISGYIRKYIRKSLLNCHVESLR